MTIFAIIALVVILTMFLQGCGKKEEESHEEEEQKPKWSDYYPLGWFIPALDYDKRKWNARDFDSARWKHYENRVINFMIDEGRKNKFDDLTLAKVLTHKENGNYFFVWTSDLEVFGKEDYWSAPDEYLIDKKGKGDCDDFAGFHCDYLHRICQYPLVWWIEVYWKRRYWNNISDSYQWKNLGHAITIYKRSFEGNWRCFSNQQLLSMTNGVPEIKDIIYKFVPLNIQQFKDDYRLTLIRARNPITGELLFEVKGSDFQ